MTYLNSISGSPQKQLRLFTDGAKAPRLIYDIPVEQCRISRFNPRKSRSPEDIDKLVKRIEAVGFDAARAIRAYAVDGIYEVFGGGTRLEAARAAGSNVHIWLYEGYAWDEIARLAEEDNEGDSYHTPVKPMDIWAEYARLRDDEGWTGKRIAEAKGVDPARITDRLQFHELPVEIKAQVGCEDCNTPLTEGHLKAVFGKIATLQLLDQWADVPAWRIELLSAAADKKQSTRQLAKAWEDRKAAVENAASLLEKLPEFSDEYLLQDGQIVRDSINWQSVFVAELIKNAALSAGDVDRCYRITTSRMEASAKRKASYDAGIHAKEQEAQEAAAKLEAILSRWNNADCTEVLRALSDRSVKLLLTDPPYGVDFQSNRRTASAKASKIDNDETLAKAAELFNRMMCEVAPKLADDAHILVFTRWDVEATFMSELIVQGYTIKGSLIWVKENHTSGDLEGSFAPRHERIIHAVKGKPRVSPRRDDVFIVARNSVTEHPTEKPVELLKQLIDCTTAKGDLVIDPFAGTGATVVAAKELGREWWGCELDETYWNDGLGRLKNDQ